MRNLIGPVPDDNTAYSDLLEHDLIDFFAMIEVLDDPAAVKRAAAGLPGKERWKAPKMTLDQARKRVPELFDLDDVPCSVRADFDTNANATSARQAARAALSGTGRGMLVWTMSDSVLVAMPSYFEAVMLKKVLDRQPGVRAVRAEKVASSPGAPPRK